MTLRLYFLRIHKKLQVYKCPILHFQVLIVKSLKVLGTTSTAKRETLVLIDFCIWRISSLYRQKALTTIQTIHIYQPLQTLPGFFLTAFLLPHTGGFVCTLELHQFNCNKGCFEEMEPAWSQLQLEIGSIFFKHPVVYYEHTGWTAQKFVIPTQILLFKKAKG